MMADDADKLKELICESVRSGVAQQIVLSKPARRSDTTPQRIDIRRVRIRDEICFQWSEQRGSQAFHQNHGQQQTYERLLPLAGTDYRHLTIRTATDEWSARYSKRGVCHLQRQPSASTATTDEHNRSRQYLIPDGTPVPFLQQTGIMTATGRVRAKYFHKFRQINRFVEFIRDVAAQLPQDRPIRIVDFGCGKSYLTFATHYYLTEVEGRAVDIRGLDQRQDVVQTCRDIVEALQLDNLQFEQNDIAAYRSEEQIDMVIALHACDTATDDAIAQAVEWQSEVILTVPCCQHELQSHDSKPVVPLLSQHGILQERFCSLSTDAVRAALLEAVGYQTQVIEFIETEHTAKNLLIRAVRQPQSQAANLPNNGGELSRFCEVFGVPPLHLQRTLQEKGLLDSQSPTATE